MHYLSKRRVDIEEEFPLDIKICMLSKMCFIPAENRIKRV
jgi:hypothetical protein